MRVVHEEFCRVDGTSVDLGVFHNVRLAYRRGISVLRPVGTDGDIDAVRDRRNILLLLDIRLLQKR